ncbi:hypothetical protein Tco_0271896, partial [Tanacetum coccineum]
EWNVVLPKREWGERGVKEKNLNRALNNENVKDGVVPSATVDSAINNGTQDENLGQFSSTAPSASEAYPASVSFATLLKGDSTRKDLNFCTLITSAGKGADVAVSLESIRVINEWCINTAYDFFLGKRVAYLVVANYVRNTWGKYGLVRSMLNSSMLFFFLFSFMDGLDAMLENEDVSNVSVWVKLYGVSVTAFNEDGLSAIAPKFSTPLMLDSYTSDVYMQSWDRH